LTRIVGIASALYLVGYALASILTGQDSVWLGDFAQVVPPIAFAGLALVMGRRSTRQVRVFWNLNAAHGLIWASGQIVWTYYDLVAGAVPIISPTDPIFFLSSIPVAAALYGRPERDRPRWLFDIVLLDIVLIALFAVFTYAYFALTLAVTDGPDDVYNTNLTQLFNVRNFLLAAWAAHVWYTAQAPAWRRVLGLYAAGLTFTFAGGLVYDVLDATGSYAVGGVWGLVWMLPYAVLCMSAAQAYDDQLFEPTEPEAALSRLPVVSLIAVALLVLIPTVDEVSRRLFDVSPMAQELRTRLALMMMIPFGVVVVVREFLSRRTLLRAGAELVSAREELAHKEKLAAVGQLVSGVAHELNNPLQGVLGYAELMASAQRDAPEAEELKAIRENANRAAGIVHNLLTFAGRSSPSRTWEQINAIVGDAAQRRRPALETSGIRLELRLADRLPLVYVDTARFQQVLDNLLENAKMAIDARRSGRAPAAAVPSQDAGEIVMTTWRAANPDRIAIEIADNGSGVRTEDLSKIFDPFFTTRGVGEGMGLGLSICYGIVREHGGLISGRNRDGGGAVFTVELPVSPESTEHAEGLNTRARDARMPSRQRVVLPEPARPAIVGRKPRALVVDDEDSNATLVRRALGQVGYDVESTTLSRRALAMIERSAYDVVIADVKMPEMNGQELYRRAGQLRPEMARRFVFITGDIDGEDTLDFLENSGCAYFIKPFNLECLTSAVDQMVKGDRQDGRIG
jgi:signal transduction histidine kinase/ActR/RegA family two-component response regulator